MKSCNKRLRKTSWNLRSMSKNHTRYRKNFCPVNPIQPVRNIQNFIHTKIFGQSRFRMRSLFHKKTSISIRLIVIIELSFSLNAKVHINFLTTKYLCQLSCFFQQKTSLQSIFLIKLSFWLFDTFSLPAYTWMSRVSRDFNLFL